MKFFASSSISALYILRSHGLGSHKLHEVARMTSLAVLLYASSSWWGFTSAQDRQRLENMVRRMIRWGFLADDAPTFESLGSAANQRLFKAITTDQCHVLHRYLPNQKHPGYNLRPGPTSTSCLTKTSTILSSGYSTRTSTVRRLNFCATYMYMYQRCVES